MSDGNVFTYPKPSGLWWAHNCEATHTAPFGGKFLRGAAVTVPVSEPCPRCGKQEHEAPPPTLRGRTREREEHKQ